MEKIVAEMMIEETEEEEKMTTKTIDAEMDDEMVMIEEAEEIIENEVATTINVTMIALDPPNRSNRAIKILYMIIEGNIKNKHWNKLGF